MSWTCATIRSSEGGSGHGAGDGGLEKWVYGCRRIRCAHAPLERRACRWRRRAQTGLGGSVQRTHSTWRRIWTGGSTRYLDGGDTTHRRGVDGGGCAGGGVRDLSAGDDHAGAASLVCRGEVMLRTELEEGEAAAPAPGMGVRHYAPRARLMLVEGIQPGLDEALMVEVNRLEEAGEVVGVMAPRLRGSAGLMRKKPFDRGNSRWATTRCMSTTGDRGRSRRNWRRSSTRGCAGWMRAGVTAIVCPLPEPVGIGLAVRDRLLRAGNQAIADSG